MGGGGPHHPCGITETVGRTIRIGHELLAEAFQDDAVAIGVLVVAGAATPHRNDQIIWIESGSGDDPIEV
jgi:hypothetical protein